MNGPGSTAALVLLVTLGAPLLARSVETSRREVEAVAASNRALETQATLLRAKRDSQTMLEAEVAERRASLARSMALFPSPEIATHERLLECAQEWCEASGFQMKSFSCCHGPRAMPPDRGFRELYLVLAFEGSHAQLLGFLRRLESHPTFVRVNSFTVTRPDVHRPDDPEGGPRLTLALNFSTFRFEDPER